MPPKVGAMAGIDRSCTIRPPRCATGPRTVTKRVQQQVDLSAVEHGVFQINLNTMSCMESSDARMAHPLMREEPNGGGDSTAGPEFDYPSADGTLSRRAPATSSKTPAKPRRAKDAAFHHRHALSTSSAFSLEPEHVTDHSQIPFSVKTQLEIWLQAFQDEQKQTRSRSICYELLLHRVREVSSDQKQPSLFSTVTALILMTQFVPQLGVYGDMMQGILAELASAVYLLPSKGVGFTVALDAYAKKTFFDAFREVRVLYDLHLQRQKRYKSLLRLEANVLQNSIDRWCWQSMNIAFRAWRHHVRERRRRLQYLTRFFNRWSWRQFVPRAIQRWHRHARLLHLLAQEERDTNDALLRIQVLYAQEQAYRGQLVGLESERDQQKEHSSKLEAELLLQWQKKQMVIRRLRAVRQQRRSVIEKWCVVMQMLFGDLHETVISRKDNLKAAPDTLPQSLRRKSSVRRQASIVSIPDPDSPVASTQPLPRRASINISDSAALFRRKAGVRMQRLSTASLVATIQRFAIQLRETLQNTDPLTLAEYSITMLEAVLGADVPMFRVSTADLVGGDQPLLQLLIQISFQVLLGGHVSTFLKESTMGHPKDIRIMITSNFRDDGPEDDDDTTADEDLADFTISQYDSRTPSRSALEHVDKLQHDGGHAVEAAVMVKDVEIGQGLLQPLVAVHRDSMQQIAEMAQQGQVRRVHRMSQRFIAMFELFHNGEVPKYVLEASLQLFLTARDWRRVSSLYPEDGIASTVDLVQYVRDVSDVTTHPEEIILLHIEAGLELTPAMVLFVQAAQVDVVAAIATNKDVVKLLLRRCSDLLEEPIDTTTLSATSRAVLKRGTSKRYAVRRDKFASLALELLQDLQVETVPSEASLLDAFDAVEDIRAGIPPPSDSVVSDSEPDTSAATSTTAPSEWRMDTGCFDAAAVATPPRTRRHFVDETAFNVLLLYVSHFVFPDPYSPSAIRIARFLAACAPHAIRRT